MLVKPVVDPGKTMKMLAVEVYVIFYHVLALFVLKYGKINRFIKNNMKKFSIWGIKKS